MQETITTIPIRYQQTIINSSMQRKTIISDEEIAVTINDWNQEEAPLAGSLGENQYKIDYRVARNQSGKVCLMKKLDVKNYFKYRFGGVYYNSPLQNATEKETVISSQRDEAHKFLQRSLSNMAMIEGELFIATYPPFYF